jgi:hypothetical protein
MSGDNSFARAIGLQSSGDTIDGDFQLPTRSLSGQSGRMRNYIAARTERCALVASAVLSVGLFVVACGSSDGESGAAAQRSSSPASDAPVSESSASATTIQSPPFASDATVKAGMPSLNMAVEDALVPGQKFHVRFDGRLRDSRGGYFWLNSPSGAPLALLRSDGNPEIPIGYSRDVTHATMLADGLSGERSTLILPPDLAPGSYALCTADSGQEECLDVRVQAA